MSIDPRGYVSFQTALAVHGVLEDIVHAVRVATITGDREREIPGVGIVEWITLPDDLMFGYELGSVWDFPGWQVAQPEKALCDLLWLCESRGHALPIFSLCLERLEPDRLRNCAERMQVDLGRLGVTAAELAR